MKQFDVFKTETDACGKCYIQTVPVHTLGTDLICKCIGTQSYQAVETCDSLEGHFSRSKRLSSCQGPGWTPFPSQGLYRLHLLEGRRCSSTKLCLGASNESALILTQGFLQREARSQVDWLSTQSFKSSFYLWGLMPLFPMRLLVHRIRKKCPLGMKTSVLQRKFTEMVHPYKKNYFYLFFYHVSNRWILFPSVDDSSGVSLMLSEIGVLCKGSPASCTIDLWGPELDSIFLKNLALSEAREMVCFHSCV